MKLEQKLHEELMRYREINNYAKKMIMEQDAPPPPPAEDAGAPDLPPPPPPVGDVPPPPAEGDVAPLDSGVGVSEDTEEIDITDLVNMTKSIKKDIEDNKQEHGDVLGQMDAVFSKLDDLENKLGQMDAVIAKIDELKNKIDEVKPKSPQEKLELRSLDSYPFNQKPDQFFSEKKGEMQMTGKNEYVLTKDDVDNYTREITQSFNPDLEDDQLKF